jgi:thiamine biosynthesis protein ThiS
MHIQLNGQTRELDGPMSLAALLDLLGVDGRTVAVEHNRLVVRRAKYADTMIQEGSEVEIVAFIGGG